MKRKSSPRSDAPLSRRRKENMDCEDLYKKTFGQHGFMNKVQFDRHEMGIRAESAETCKFTQKPQYSCRLAMPNPLNRQWLYSVPCGQLISSGGYCSNWIFLDVPEREKENDWVPRQLQKLGWSRVKGKNRRFICPNHERP